LYNYSNEPKRWNSKCPKCNSIIRWHLNSGESGAAASAYCSNSITASGVYPSLIAIDICDWRGKVLRQRDGGVRFCNNDDTYLKE
jgi:hypothetical protein